MNRNHRIFVLTLSLLILGAVFQFGPLKIQEARAAFGTGGATCTAQSKTAGTSLTCTVATENLDAGNIAVLWFGGDNVATVDGNDGLLTSVTDSAGNTWNVQRCFTNAQTGPGTGATTCIAWSRLTTTLVSGSGTITANFSSSITAKAIVTKEFTVAAGKTIAVTGTPQDLANDAADPGPMTISGLANAEHLFVRATALERAAGGTWTVTAGFTSSGCNGTTGGGAASNMNTCGEFRIFTGTSLTSDPTATAVDNANTYIAFDEVTPTVTLGTGTDPSSQTIAPGAGATDIDAFTFVTDTGTTTITQATTTFSADISAGVSEVQITNDDGSTTYGTSTLSGTAASISLTGLVASSTSAQYKIRVVPKSHSAMPVPPGAEYTATATITDFTTAYNKSGSDSAANALTIDNLSPNDATNATTTAGDGQVTVSWDNSTSTDFSNVVVVRATSTNTGTPTEGSSPALNDVLGNGIVIYNSNGTSTVDTGLTNGTTYFYKIWSKDTNGNYSTPGVEATSTPAVGLALTQDKFRWYENNNSTTPTNPKASENSSVGFFDSGIPIRLRMNVGVTGASLGAGQQFKLQFATSQSGPWTDVGASSSGAIWVTYDNSTPADGSTIPSLLLSSSTVAASYQESPTSVGTPSSIPAGGWGEWDWVLINNSFNYGDIFYFRMVKSTGQALNNYNRYPTIGAPTGGGGGKPPLGGLPGEGTPQGGATAGGGGVPTEGGGPGGGTPQGGGTGGGGGGGSP